MVFALSLVICSCLILQASDSRKSTPSSVGMRDSVRTSELLKVGQGEYQSSQLGQIEDDNLQRIQLPDFSFASLVSS